MAVKAVGYLANLVANTERGPSEALWGPVPTSQFLEDPRTGMLFYDDFLMAGQLFSGTAGQTASGSYLGNLGQWAVWSDQYGSLDVDPALEGGVIALSSGAHSTVNITMGSYAGAVQFQGGSTAYTMQNKIVFECRVAVGSITTAKRDFFIGLVDNTTAQFTQATQGVIASTTNTLSTVPNLLGFHFRSTTNPTDVGVAFNVAGGTVQYPTNLQTLSNTVLSAALTAEAAGAGFIKLGFVFDQNAPMGLINSASTGQTAGNYRRKVLQFYVNGLVAPAYLSYTENIGKSTFPTGYLSPAISYMSRSGTSPGDAYVDWLRVAAFANS